MIVVNTILCTLRKGPTLNRESFRKAVVPGFYWIGDHGQQVVLAVEQGVVVENVECREEPMASGRHFTCVVLGLALLVADSIEDKGDQIQRGQHIGHSMVSISEVDEMDSPNSGGYRMHYIAAKGRDGAHLRGPLPEIVVELVLKHIWEHEQGKTANFNHNLHSLFIQLRPETQCDVNSFYVQYCRQYKSAIDKGRQ